MAQIRAAVQRVRQAAIAGLSDAQLLARFIDRQDAAAFAALVGRHAAMVWGVSRRRLTYHDAEEAFQASFLVLFRKAASIRSRNRLASWLYGVAYQTALQARRTAARRKTREKQVADMPEPATPEPDTWHDLQGVLDAELSRLPDHYRSVIVLCDLEGKTRKEAARQLGCPEGTVAGHLGRGRAMLSRRLRRHGLGVSGAALAALSEKASAVPLSIVSSTIATLSAQAVPASVAFLAEGVVKAMLVTKLKKTLAIVLVLGLTVTGVSFLTGRSAGQNENKLAAEKAVEPSARQNKEPFTAWGKEINGLQAGLGFRSGEKRAYHYGETLILAIRVRNVGNETVKFSYLVPYIEHVPVVTNGDGKQVPQPTKLYEIGERNPAQVELQPGKEIELHELKRELKAASESGSKRPRPEGRAHALYGTGKVSIQYEHVLGDPVMGYPGWKLHPALGFMMIDPELNKLATGKLEIQVEPKKKQDGASWGALLPAVRGTYLTPSPNLDRPPTPTVRVQGRRGGSPVSEVPNGTPG